MSNINNLYGIENVQANQLTDLNSVYFSGSNTSIDALSEVTKNINQSMTDLSKNVDGALVRQNEILDVIQVDRQQEEKRQKELEVSRTTQTRELELMETKRKQYLAYIRGILVVVVTVAILWLVRFLASIVTFLPDSFLTIIYATVIFFATVILYYMYKEEETHDRIQYDELRLTGPANRPTKMPDSSGNLLAPYFGCNGQECCGTDTIWIPEKGKCVKYDGQAKSAAGTKTAEPTPTPSPFVIITPPNY